MQQQKDLWEILTYMSDPRGKIMMIKLQRMND